MLITMAYRIPRCRLDKMLGTVRAYPLTEEFSAAWESLPTKYGSRPTYSALATALRAASGQPVQMFAQRHLADAEVVAGSRVLLLTDQPFGYELKTAVQTWERHVRDGRGTPVLHTLLPEPETARPFSDFLTFRRGQVPVAPHWVFRTAVWRIMRELAGTELCIDGKRTLTLRMDTDGSLLAWDECDLIKSANGKAFSMARVTARLITRAGIDDLVVTFDAHLSRIAVQGHGAKNAWLDRGVGREAPILRIPMWCRPDEDTGTWKTHVNPVYNAILSVCDLKVLDIPQELPPELGDFRPQAAKSPFHVLGSGLGPRFMLRLHEHVREHVQHLEPLAYEHDKAIRISRRVPKYPVGGLSAGDIEPSGHKRVTIACLYGSAEARDRMLTELEQLTRCSVRPQHDGPAVVINERLDVVARYCPELLEHTTVNRAALLDEALNLPNEQGRLTVAWVETEFPRDESDDSTDAKPHLRRLLGLRGVPSQFLATEPAVLPQRMVAKTAEQKQHAARSALRDLLRAAGVLDSRVFKATAAGTLPNRFDRRAVLVGIHARRQQAGDTAPLVLSMFGIVADPLDAAGWRVLMHNEKEGWIPAGAGIAKFHSGSIGSSRLGRTSVKADRTRVEVEQRLADLVGDDLADLPIVIFADAQATRTIWPGLQNTSFGQGALPGDQLVRKGHDVAVVRLATDLDEIGRPVTRDERANLPADPRQPAAPGRKVYRLAGASCPSWLFSGVSVTLGGQFGNQGAKVTRWSVPDESDLKRPWHSYTGTEIVVVRNGSWSPEALCALSARLCDQPISWDGRTQVPVPLHLAITVDKDHPDHPDNKTSSSDNGNDI